MFAVLRLCRMLTGQNLVPQHFSIAHHRSEVASDMTRFVGTKVEFGADTDEFALNANAHELPLVHADAYLNNLLLKYCEAALADRRGDMSQLRTRVESECIHAYIQTVDWKDAQPDADSCRLDLRFSPTSTNGFLFGAETAFPFALVDLGNRG
jgi:hypothetical protein